MTNNEGVVIKLAPGTILDGRYEIVSLIGEGAMGFVYKCKRIDLGDRFFALKVLRPEIAEDESVMDRFRNEVLTALDVSHKNVVRAYDYIDDGNFVAYTMEMVEGGDLADLMNFLDKFQVKDIVRYFKEICEGVQALHNAGIIHRDLKPENVLLTKEREVKISDFGISIIENQSRHTAQGGILGTSSYLSPEYLLESKIDHRSDIYAIGVIMFETITGEHPFPGDNLYLSMQKQMDSEIQNPRELRSDCPRALGEIVLNCLRKNPGERYQTCNEVIKDLQNYKVREEELAELEKEGLYKSESVKIDTNSGNFILEIDDTDFSSGSQKQEEVSKPTQLTPKPSTETQAPEQTSAHQKPLTSEAVRKSFSIQTMRTTPVKKEEDIALFFHFTKKTAILFALMFLALIYATFYTLENKRLREQEEREVANVRPVKTVKPVETPVVKETPVEQQKPSPRPKLDIIKLEHKFIIEKNTKYTKTNYELEFKKGEIASTNIVVVPKAQTPNKEKILVKKFTIAAKNFREGVDGIAEAFAVVSIEYNSDGEDGVLQSTGKVYVDKSISDDNVIVHYFAPQNLKVEKVKREFVFTKKAGKHLYYVTGKHRFDINKY